MTSSADIQSSEELAADRVDMRDLTRHHLLGGAVVRSLDGVTLSIGKGTFAAFVGSSGSGKSTLLNLMAGLDRPTAGVLSVFGQNLAVLSREQLDIFRRNTVGVVFQSFLLVQRLTVYENVELPLLFSSADPQTRRDRVHSLLERVGLLQRESHLPSQLSGGEQQRVAVARSLANSPELLIADEPTGNLDSRNAGNLMDLFSQIHADGNTVVLVTHERRLVEDRADFTFELSDGRLVSSSRNR